MPTRTFHEGTRKPGEIRSLPNIASEYAECPPIAVSGQNPSLRRRGRQTRADSGRVLTHIKEILPPKDQTPGMAISTRHSAASRVIDELGRDHKNVARLLSLMDKQLAALSRNEKPDFQVMADIMSYMTHYPDMFHHPREELVFTRLEKRSADAARLIKELRYEHQLLSESGADLFDSIKQAINDQLVERELLVTKAHGYSAMLLDHMRKEDAGIFPLAQVLLAPEEWAAINREMDIPSDPLFEGKVEKGFLALQEFLTSHG
ncbi:MAG: hemerythrin domain-containing protein [Proteobacteria bacterium]|nr:hemerythrin domain-containing protein [Pseudomonadota bacterium]